jgi:hypothetical protein
VEDRGLVEEHSGADKVLGGSLFVPCRAIREHQRTDGVLGRPAADIFQLVKLTKDRMATR